MPSGNKKTVAFVFRKARMNRRIVCKLHGCPLVVSHAHAAHMHSNTKQTISYTCKCCNPESVGN